MPATALAKPVSPVLRSGDPLARGLVLGLPLHEGGGTTAYDASGRGSHGTLVNGVAWGDSPWGKCLTFDGSSGHVDCGGVMTFSDTPGFTVAGWFRPDVVDGNWHSVCSKVNSDNTNRQFFIGVSGGFNSTANSLVFFTKSSSNLSAYSATTLTAGRWYHFAAVHSGAGATGNTLYLDGAPGMRGADVDGSGNSGVDPDAGTNRLTLGRFTADNPLRLVGAVGSIAVYDRPLSAAEVAALYADSWRIYRPRRAWILRGGGGGSGITGSASGTLTSITGAASGSLTVTGSASGVITPVTGIASGTVTIASNASGMLASLTGSATGTLTITGSASGSLSRITGSASSGDQITGTASASLSRVTGAASGTVSQSGAASGSLQAITGSASGSLSLTGSAEGELSRVQGAASGAVTLTGAGSGALQPITGSAAGDLYLPGAAVGTLLSITGSASGSLTIQGTASGSLRPITGRASDTPQVTGTASGTLSAITGSATGSIFLIGSHPVLTWKAQDPGRCWRTLDPGRCWKPPGRI